jgi:hypothetical protein
MTDKTPQAETRHIASSFKFISQTAKAVEDNKDSELSPKSILIELAKTLLSEPEQTIYPAGRAPRHNHNEL